MSKVLIIAEVGVNHNGDIRIAKRLIDEAKQCGVDVVKFQTFNPQKLASKQAKMVNRKQKRSLNKLEISSICLIALFQETS